MKHAEEGDKTKFLNKLANKIHDLEKRGGQNAKKIALCGIYFHFKKFDFSPQSKANLLELIQEKHEQLKTFDSTVGQIGAFIKQFFFHPRKEKRNDTENIIEELVDFINSQKQAPKSKKISR